MKPKTSWIVCVGCNHDACGAIKSEVGGCSTGNHFVSFVRAYARSGCLVELDLKLCWLPFCRFPFGLGELSLSPFAMEAPWRLVEARLCTSLHRFCIVNTIKKQAFCTIEALRDSGLYNIKLGSPRASTDRRGCQPRHLEF